MAEWNNNNAAHVNTWAVLLSIKQIDRNFKNSGGLTMSELRLHKNGNPAVAAPNIAAALDGIFCNTRFGYGAEYEDGTDAEAALSALEACLIDSAKTVNELADVADEKYKFLTE